MRTSLVTGGTRGVGLALAEALLKEGDAVAIAARDPEALEGTVGRLSAQCGDPSRVAGFVTDVRDRASVDALVASTVDRFGRLDVVVNNAARGLSQLLETTSPDEWQDVFATNVSGPFYVCRAAIPELRRSGGGFIVNVASLAGNHPFAKGSAYCASKAALIAMTESLMHELRHDGIRVSVVLPGSIATAFSGPRPADDSWKSAPSDVAEAICDLLRFSPRTLPSRIELRPARPQRK